MSPIFWTSRKQVGALAGFEPALAGFEIHFLYLIGIQEHKYADLKHKKMMCTEKASITPFLKTFDGNSRQRFSSFMFQPERTTAKQNCLPFLFVLSFLQGDDYTVHT